MGIMPIAFAAVGIALIFLGLFSVHRSPALAGAVFAIGMLFAFLGFGYIANQIRARRSQTDSDEQENQHRSEKDPG